ncbi:MAG: carboxypeptidase regulatory-like domain-containing protein, partial [Verrucomicrobia bacterium]|nr:carboxypeptidase regulatory-like domain-containing protein [Verrucomicrobiota bacterium]
MRRSPSNRTHRVRWLPLLLGLWWWFPLAAAAQQADHALVLDGGGHLELPDDLLAGRSEATIEGWFRADRIAPAAWMEFGFPEHRLLVESVEYRPDLRCVVIEPGRDPRVLTAPGLLATNQWCHVAVTLGPAGVRLYVNGVLAAEDPGQRPALPGAGSRNRIGGSRRPEDPPMVRPQFSGRADRLAVWSRERSAEEIRGELGQAPVGDQPDLVGSWTFDPPDPGAPSAPTTLRTAHRLVGSARTAPHPTLNANDALPPVVFTGTVQDARGNPSPGATIRVFCGDRWIQSLAADGRGSFRFLATPGVPPLDIGVFHQFAEFWQQGIAVAPGGDRQLECRLGPSGVISGTVRALDGSPLSGVVVQALRERAAGPGGEFQATDAVLSNELGEYRFRQLRPGTYQVRAQIPGTNVLVNPMPLRFSPGTMTTNLDVRVRPFKKGTWRTLNDHDGLYSLGVRCLHTDRRGIRWIGTHNGLFRYDGSRMTSFTTEEGL